VLEKRVLRRIFGPKREEVAVGWRRLHKEDLHNLYASPNIWRLLKPKKQSRAGYIACMGDMRNVYKMVRKPESKRPCGRPSHRWEDNSRMDLRKIGWEAVYCIQLAQDREWWQTLTNIVITFGYYKR
jgi:hypothetical protein